jgi:hypothetical protein
LAVIATMQNVQAQAGSCVTYDKGAGPQTSCFHSNVKTLS